MTRNAKPVGIAFSAEHVSALLADRTLTARLNAASLPFAIAGLDRLDSAIRPTDRVTGVVEPSAALLADRAPDLGWLTVAAADLNRAFHVARRVASADYRSGGQSGLVLGLRDWSAPAGCDGRELWAGPALPAATRDAAAAIRALWESARREFDTDSPLAIPASPQGAPVLAWRAESTGEAAAAGRVADVLIWPASLPTETSEVARASEYGPRVFLELPVGGGDLRDRLAENLADPHVAGAILRPAATVAALRDFVDVTLPGLISAGTVRTGWSGSLRTRMSLPARSAAELRPAAARQPVAA